MELLTLSQIIFNFTASVAILVVGLLIGTIAYEVIIAIRNIKKFFHDLNEKSMDLYRHLDSLFLTISTLPFLSMWFKKGKKKKE